MKLLKLCLVATFLGVATSNTIQPIAFNFSTFNFQRLFSNNDFKQLLRANKPEQVAVMNKFIDEVVKDLDGVLKKKGIDPLGLPDEVKSFEWNALWGEVSLKSGKLTGVGKIQRNGDVTFKYQFPNLRVTFPLKFDHIEINYNYRAQFVGLGPQGELYGSIKGAAFFIDVEIDVTKLQARIIKHDLENLGDLFLYLKGSILEWFANVLVWVLNPVLKPIIQLVLYNITHGTMDGLIGNFNGMIKSYLDRSQIL